MMALHPLSDEEFARQFMPPPTPIRGGAWEPVRYPPPLYGGGQGRAAPRTTPLLFHARTAGRMSNPLVTGADGGAGQTAANPWYGVRVKLVADHYFAARSRLGAETWVLLTAGATGTVWCRYTFDGRPMLRVLMDIILYGYDYPLEHLADNFARLDEPPRPDLLVAVGYGPERALPVTSW